MAAIKLSLRRTLVLNVILFSKRRHVIAKNEAILSGTIVPLMLQVGWYFRFGKHSLWLYAKNLKIIHTISKKTFYSILLNRMFKSTPQYCGRTQHNFK